MNPTTIITYYTPEIRIYAEAARKLQSDCDRLGLTLQSFALRGTKNRHQNIRRKIEVIHEAARMIQTPMLWLDADSRILKRPDFIADCPHDFVARRNPVNPDKGWAGGVMYFNTTEAARELIARAKLFINFNDALNDEGAMREAAFSMGDRLNVGALPETCFVGHTTSTIGPNDHAAEIIIHINRAWWAKRGRLGESKRSVPIRRPEFAKI